MKPKPKCTVCGRPMASSRKVADALALVFFAVTLVGPTKMHALNR